MLLYITDRQAVFIPQICSSDQLHCTALNSFTRAGHMTVRSITRGSHQVAQGQGFHFWASVIIFHSCVECLIQTTTFLIVPWNNWFLKCYEVIFYFWYSGQPSKFVNKTVPWIFYFLIFSNYLSIFGHILRYFERVFVATFFLNVAEINSILQVAAKNTAIVTSCDQILICSTLPDTSIPLNTIGEYKKLHTWFLIFNHASLNLIDHIRHQRIKMQFSYLHFEMVPLFAT